MDLWSQFELMGEGLSGFMSFKNFRAFHGRYGRFHNNKGSSVSKLIGLKNVPLIQERLARIAFLMTKEEANLNLPDKQYDYAEVDMTARQAKIYKNVATRLVHEIEAELEQSTNKRITAQHILTKLLRLAQITSGHVAWDKDYNLETLEIIGGGVEQIDRINPKVQYVLDEINDPNRDPNGKIIVWACFIEDLRIISQRLAEEGINHVGYHKVTHSDYRVKDSVEAENKINFDDSCRVLLANPQSGGIGQNYLGYDKDNPDASTMYVDREIFFSCNWSHLQRSQAEDRAHRRDARAPGIRITDLIVPGTIDEEIRERLKYKKQMAMEIQDVKAILRKVANL
jgi:SNF2 family DNA or RNA helicase